MKKNALKQILSSFAFLTGKEFALTSQNKNYFSSTKSKVVNSKDLRKSLVKLIKTFSRFYPLPD
jgi:hypothetical protein